MADSISPEFGIINERYIQLITRSSLTSGVQTGQGIRLVNVVANLQDASGTDQLTCWSMAMFVWGGNGFNIMARQLPISNVKLGNLWGYLNSTELILYSDYIEQGGIPPNVHVGFQAVVANADAAAAHNVTYRLDMIVEYYTLKAVGHIGFP